MAALPRPGSGAANKKSGMKPPINRPTAPRSQSALTCSQARAQSGTTSPAESQLSSSTTTLQQRSPPKTGAGAKRKERDYDVEGSEETNIHVVVRCRGRSEREVRENSGVVLSTDGVRGQNVELSMGPSALSNKTYHFDKVFSPAADQSMIYDEVVMPILDEMLAGYNCTIFAYGQTGTGKTYTMSGDMSDTLGLISDSAGIIPRILNSLFRKLDTDEGESSVKCSFIELYNEELRDLLSPDDSIKLKIYEDNQKKGHTATLVQGMEESHIKSAADGIQLLRKGSHKRQVAATKCNDLSSRSHTVFTVTTYIKRAADMGEDFVCAGKLNLVDLAGSENIQRSGAENKRAAEAGLINKSLLTLGRVINALVERGSHIPYRESKLTRLLQDSLGGRTKTCIIATVSPAKSNLEETISTLDYAFRAKNIRNKPQMNAMISKKTLLKEFTAEIEKLKGELIATRQRNGVYLTAETYDEIMVQSESRRILSEEQKERIETIEVSLRNKVQELFDLTNTFTSLRKDLDSARQTLDETKGILQKTDFVLADTRQSLANEALLRKAHQSTEESLSNVSRELISTLDQTVEDVEGLQLKIKRKSELQDRNRIGWQTSLGQVVDTTTLVEGQIAGFQSEQGKLISRLSSRMQTFVQGELERLTASQDLLKSKLSSFEASESEVIHQSAGAKEEMHNVLEEIKVLREEVKQQVAEGLNGLSAAAGRISAGVIDELGSFHTQLHLSYSSLGKEFKSIFDDLTKRLQAQRIESDSLRQMITASAKTAIQSDADVLTKLRTCLQEEREKCSHERRTLLSQIGDLIDQNAQKQDSRWAGKIQELEQDISLSRSTLITEEESYNGGMKRWSDNEQQITNNLLNSREALKLKMKEDWRAINDRNTSIQQTTESVHEETIRIVDAQMAEVAKQMQALDDFVLRARSQNQEHHDTHVQSLKGLASNVHDSYSNISEHFATTFDRLREAGDDICNQSTAIQAAIPPFSASSTQLLADLRTNISDAPLQEYVSTGSTPLRRQYLYPSTLPRTEPHDKLLSRKRSLTRNSPTKSPSKTKVYTDAPAQDATPPTPLSPSKDSGLREINLNVGSSTLQRTHSDSAALTVGGKLDADAAGMGPPPLKRQATESKLPTKLGGLNGKTGMVRLEGRENLNVSYGSSGRRLRSSHSD